MAHQKFDMSKIARLDDAGRFDTMRPEVMWDALGEPQVATIVDIGAGTGLFAQRFSELAPQATVFAVDTEPAMLEWMREHRDAVATGAVVPVLSQEAHVPLDDGVADLVIMLNLHHELVSAVETYREAWRLLAPDGQVLVVDWAPRDTPKGPPLEIRSSEDAIAADLRDAGFDTVVAHVDALPWHSLVTGAKA